MSNPRIRLMSHLIAGFPDLGESARVAEGLVDGGSEFLEVQFPYSDPTADGVAIQSACESALEKGFRVDDGFRLVDKLTESIDRPIFIMSYAGLVVARGIDRFLAETKSAGAEGVIIPDLMPGYDEGLFETGDKYGLAVVPVVAPSVTDSRLAEILAIESPFLYAAIRTGITGKRSEIDSNVVDFLSRLKRPETTLIAGFGISDADQARNLQTFADVLVVGSAFVRAVIDGIGSNADIREVVARKARELSGGVLEVEKEETADRRGNSQSRR